MNQLIQKGSWNLAKGKAKQAVGAIKEDPRLENEGKKDELKGRGQRALGHVQEDVSNAVKQIKKNSRA